jgi:hypothetical protein
MKDPLERVMVTNRVVPARVGVEPLVVAVVEERRRAGERSARAASHRLMSCGSGFHTCKSMFRWLMSMDVGMIRALLWVGTGGGRLSVNIREALGRLVGTSATEEA